MAGHRTLSLAAPNPWGVWLAAGAGLLVLALLGAWIWIKPHRVAVASAPITAPLPTIAASATGSGPPTVAATSPKAAALEARRAAAAAGRWSQLTPLEQSVLAPLQEDWTELNKDQRAKWFDLAQRFHSLLPDEQQRIQTRMVDWARMSPAERGAARLNFQEIRQLSAKERLERWEAYQGLDADERKQLAERGQASVQNVGVARRSDPTPPVPKSSGAVTEALAAQTAPTRSVGATVVQAPMGATTLLVSRLPSTALPATGPKIAATADFVDRATLLPQPRVSRATAPVAAEPVPAGDTPPAEVVPNETPPASGG